MAKLVEMVRNSPLMGRRAGGYEVLDTTNKDPFARGILYEAQFVASIDVHTQHDCPEVQDKVAKACENAQKSGKSSLWVLRKVTIVVKSNNIRVTDISNKVHDDYPMFRVAYCGGHERYNDVFFFIHRTKIDKQIKAEVFKLASHAKVKAVTLTVAKAFNIAYKAWMAEKRRKEKEQNRGSESPMVQRKQLAKMAPGVASAAGPYTPQAHRKEDSEVQGRPRRGSLGDKPEAVALRNPAVIRVVAQNEATGSTHNVTLTDEFDEFQQLAESRSRPDVLRTSLAIDETDNFSFDSIKAHIDSESESSAQ